MKHLKNSAFAIVIGVIGLSACDIAPPEVSQDTRDLLTRCGAGVQASQGIGAELEADIGEDLDATGSLSTRVESELQAAFLDSPAGTPEGYEAYLQCIQQSR